MNIHSAMGAGTTATAGTAATAVTSDSAKRQAILDAALALFAERTFEGTPVPLIAERAGVGAGTIYRYFDDKTALVNGLYQHWKHALAVRVVPPAPIDDPRAEFHHWWDGLWRFASEYPAAFAFLETQHHSSYLDECSHDAGSALTASAIAYVRRAQAAGAIRKAKPEMLIAMVFGAFTGIAKGGGDAGLTYNRKDVAASEACMWSMLRP